MADLDTYINQHKDAFLQDLIQWCRIPAISCEAARAGDVRRSAEALAERCKAVGFTRVEIWETKGHPSVFASWMGAPGKPTVLVYGHHDVQPVEPLDEWDSPPFEPTLRDGRLYGRGVIDDKGQVHIHLSAFESWMKTVGTPPLNIKLIVEGEEEIGSENLGELLSTRRDELEADSVVISDTPMFAKGVPSLCVGLRGLAYCEIELSGASMDLHSGSYGGGVANPATALARLIGSFHDEQGQIAVEGFYRDVRPLRAQERDGIAALPFDEPAWLDAVGAPAAVGEAGWGTLERIWARPTLEINGLLSGHTGEGAKTIIPARAMAKVSCRLVPDQQPDAILDALEAHVAKHAPAGLRWRVTRYAGGLPWVTDTDSPAFDAARRALGRAFGRDTVSMREGGSIPFVRTIADAMQKPCLLVGFGLPDENAHAPNEWMDLDSYVLGIRSAAYLYEELAKL